MADRREILDYLREELRLSAFKDDSLNGLQIEGRREIRRIGAAVDAGGGVISAAAAWNTDLLLVHHGLFWAKPLAITGGLRQLVAESLAAEMNLVAVHLPLDAHPRLGNNALLAARLGLSELKPAAAYAGSHIGWCGDNARGLSLEEISRELGQLQGAGKAALTLAFGPEVPKRVCIVSGSAADQLYNFETDDFDTLITGEAKQFAYHFCRDNKLNAVFAGHYATETVGVQALAEELSKRFNVEWRFFDHPTGI